MSGKQAYRGGAATLLGPVPDEGASRAENRTTISSSPEQGMRYGEIIERLLSDQFPYAAFTFCHFAGHRHESKDQITTIITAII